MGKVNIGAKMNENSIKIDWLRLSFNSTAWGAIAELFGQPERWEQSGHYNRTHAYTPIEGCLIAVDEIPHHDYMPPSRFTVNMSGNGIGHFFEHNPSLDITSFCQLMLTLDGCKINRLDIAYDDYQELLNIYIMHIMARGGENVVTRWRKATMVMSGKIGEDDQDGETLYLGNRQSDSFLRVYDKRAQELARGANIEALPTNWVRCELELKGKVADAVGRDLVGQSFNPSAMVGLLRSKIDFHQEGEGRPQRRPLSGWWEQFTRGLEQRPIGIAKPVQSIERKSKWVTDSVAPTLALLMEAHKGDMEWLIEVLKDGGERLTPNDRKLLDGLSHGS